MTFLEHLFAWLLCLALAWSVPAGVSAENKKDKDEERDYEKSRYIAPSPEIGQSHYIFNQKGDPIVRDKDKKKDKKKKKRKKGKRKKISRKPGKHRPKGWSRRKSSHRSAPARREPEPEAEEEAPEDDVGTSRGGAIKVGKGRISIPKRRTAPHPQMQQQGGIGGIYHGSSGEGEGGDKKESEAKGEKVPAQGAGGGMPNFGSAIPTQQ